MRHSLGSLLILRWPIKVAHDPISRVVFDTMVSYCSRQDRPLTRCMLSGTFHLPSSNTRRAIFSIFTNPCVSASANTACVETTTLTSRSTASQIRCSLQRSTPSSLIKSLIFTGGMCDSIASFCWEASAIVGVRNQTICLQ